jgi:hypothetical protein
VKIMTTVLMKSVRCVQIVKTCGGLERKLGPSNVTEACMCLELQHGIHA